MGAFLLGQQMNDRRGASESLLKVAGKNSRTKLVVQPPVGLSEFEKFFYHLVLGGHFGGSFFLLWKSTALAALPVKDYYMRFRRVRYELCGKAFLGKAAARIAGREPCAQILIGAPPHDHSREALRLLVLDFRAEPKVREKADEVAGGELGVYVAAKHARLYSLPNFPLEELGHLFDGWKEVPVGQLGPFKRGMESEANPHALLTVQDVIHRVLEGHAKVAALKSSGERL
jgi:hypothetical protein